ncbi:hypothetical protein SLOPH_1159, partial [Spraguea lophii 42_110]
MIKEQLKIIQENKNTTDLRPTSIITLVDIDDKDEIEVYYELIELINNCNNNSKIDNNDNDTDITTNNNNTNTTNIISNNKDNIITDNNVIDILNNQYFYKYINTSTFNRSLLSSIEEISFNKEFKIFLKSLIIYNK